MHLQIFPDNLQVVPFTWIPHALSCKAVVLTGFIYQIADCIAFLYLSVIYMVYGAFRTTATWLTLLSQEHTIEKILFSYHLKQYINAECIGYDHLAVEITGLSLTRSHRY